jgi:hypothetical protein
MTTDPVRPKASPWPFIGMAGMAYAFFLYAASVLFVPWWVVVLLLVVWAALMVVASAWWTPHPTWVPWVPALALVLWVVVVLSA